MKRTLLIVAVLVVAAGSGCGRRRPDPALFVKPTIAVMKFENRAPFPMNWSLGDGMADILVDRLVETRRYHVIERPELDSIIRELSLQRSGATREKTRAALGQIKNVQYLIKGTVTDFGHVASEKGFFRGGGTRVFGSHARAVMGMTFYVVHVESGEIVASDRLQESVHASEVDVSQRYKGVAMGGSVFYQTPLGQATASVMDRAVGSITDAIASQRWRPKIAMVDPNGVVVLNGGANRRIKAGWIYEILEAGSPIIDPDTGDLLGRRSPNVIGRLRVVKVSPRYCDAEIADGDPATFKIGLACRYLPPAPKEGEAARDDPDAPGPPMRTGTSSPPKPYTPSRPGSRH